MGCRGPRRPLAGLWATSEARQRVPVFYGMCSSCGRTHGSPGCGTVEDLVGADLAARLHVPPRHRGSTRAEGEVSASGDIEGAGSVAKTPRAPRERDARGDTALSILRLLAAVSPPARDQAREGTLVAISMHVPYLSRRHSRKRKLSIAVSRVGGKTDNLADTGLSQWSIASHTRQPAISSEMFVPPRLACTL